MLYKKNITLLVQVGFRGLDCHIIKLL